MRTRTIELVDDTEGNGRLVGIQRLHIGSWRLMALTSPPEWVVGFEVSIVFTELDRFRPDIDRKWI
jgi:hypothetical protein